jgi:hypothetical protein
VTERARAFVIIVASRPSCLRPQPLFLVDKPRS